MTQPDRSYSYEGPVTLWEGGSMEAGDELLLGLHVEWGREWHRPPNLCGALRDALGLRRDGDTVNVRITVEVIE